MKRGQKYIRIDQSIGDHPRVLKLNDRTFLAAIGLHVLAIAYCDRMRTDGVISARVLSKIVQVPKKAALNDLLRVGLWENETYDDEPAYRIHDYLDWQNSSAEINSRSKAAKERAERRWGNAECNAEVSAEGNAQRIAQGIAERNAQRNADKTRQDINSGGGVIPIVTDTTTTTSTDSGFEAAWAAFPVHVSPDYAAAAFSAAVADGADPDAIVAACRAVPRSHRQALGFFIADGTWRDHVPAPPKAPVCPVCDGRTWVMAEGDPDTALACPACSGGGTDG